jgi:hypothetical protein
LSSPSSNIPEPEYPDELGNLLKVGDKVEIGNQPGVITYSGTVVALWMDREAHSATPWALVKRNPNSHEGYCGMCRWFQKINTEVDEPEDDDLIESLL